ncbi:MAG: Slp family lipoprotein [Desulfobacterales bacterium]|jgi:outer membrane lipoprotein
MQRQALAIVTILMAYGGLLGCRVISGAMMDEALRDVHFSQLTQDPSAFRGQTVILGGHVIEVRNEAQETLMLILQTPLGFGQQPLPPDRSGGRFMVRHEGFLDPEVFAKGRTITVAGQVTGVTREAIDHDPYDYVILTAREIYLWERYEDLYPYGYRSPFYDPWYDRRPWYRHRYR